MVLLNSRLLALINIGSSGVAQVIRRLLGCLPLAEEIIGRQCRSEIDRLPEWVLVSQIFLCLRTSRDVARARCVCKHWNLLLNSMEFRRLWWEDCTDVEQWMIRSEMDMEPPEIRWSAAMRLLCDPGIAPLRYLEATVRPSVEVASSHGLVCWVCHDESYLLSIAVGNPRTKKWKLLPPLPVGDVLPRSMDFAYSSYSMRFIRHDLLAQTYTIFFQVFFKCVRREFAFLYDSQSAAWLPVDQQPMPCDRFCSGLRDASVTVIDFHYVHIAKGVTVDEVGIVAYDSCNHSWDEVSVKLQHPSGRCSIDIAGATRGGTCYGIRVDSYRTSTIDHVSLCAHAKDECCRLLTSDGITGRICLWQLDEKSTAFKLVSTIQRHPKCPWLQDRNSDAAVSVGRIQSWTCVIRSDDRLFMAVFIYGVWSWLIVYDVGRSLWLMAHAYGDSRGLRCRLHFEGCRWPILEYDVRWHDAHDIVLSHTSAAAIEGWCPSAPATNVAASSGRRLHLVHAPDIWSSP